jgi:hypothetical protein
VSGFLIASSDLRIKGPLKGVAISFLVLLPCAMLISWNTPMTLVPIMAMTLVLGSLLGFLIGRYGK